MPEKAQDPSTAAAARTDRQVLDLRGLKCPLPVLQTKRALARLPSGSVLDVRCSDPLASLDIPNLVRETGDVLLSRGQQDGELAFLIRKRAPEPEPAGRPGEDPSTAAGVDRR